MPINTALLVSAPMLQDYFVDKSSGLPLKNGIVTCYKDNSRTTFKNWYYQTGNPGNYTYVTLPNPMTLSAVGTIVDVNGNDTIPFFYPYSETDNSTVETYYITVQSSDLQSQFVRANFPFVNNTANSVDTDQNYSFNNSFWRNIGVLALSPSNPLKRTTNVTGSTLFYEIVAPSQHDGFTMPDIEYMKSGNNSTETITFQKFTNGSNPLIGDITPEFYVEHVCSSPAAEGLKFYQIPICLHIKQLDNQQATFTIQAKSNSGSSNDVLTISLFQFNGTGAVQVSPVIKSTIQLTSTWTKYQVPFTFPSTAGAPISPGDDAWYIQIGVPSNNQFNLSFTLPSLFFSQTSVPTNGFTTYDQVDSIINTPRTGDLRVTVNDFYPYGWVPMNDGTIGNGISNATARSNTDTWQLFYLLWNKFSPFLNQISPIFDSAGTLSVYGGSAIADFNANKALSLTKNMAKVMMGTVPFDALINIYKTTFTPSHNIGGTVINASNAMNLYNGATVTFSVSTGGVLPNSIAANTIYYVSGFNGVNAFFISTTFANALAGVHVADYVNVPSGTLTVAAYYDGSVSGEYAHAQTVQEMAAHNHAGSATVPFFGFGTFSGGSGFAHVNGGNPVALNITSNGNNVPANIVQPTSFNNYFIKL